MPKAIILLSGGLDSATCLAFAIHKGYEVLALTFDYGQRHRIEIKKARIIAKKYNVKKHIILKIDLSAWGGSSLVTQSRIPKGRSPGQMLSHIPSTYVPARNLVFLSLALAFAEASHACAIFIGANAIDYSGYPDCRPPFINGFEKLARIATKAGIQGKKIKIHAPLLKKDKSQIILLAQKLGVDFSLTHSCYNPQKNGSPCGVCDSCVLRKKGFIKAGIKDPLFYNNIGI